MWVNRQRQRLSHAALQIFALAGVTFGLVLVVGCQPLPRPFAHQDGLDRDILRIPDGGGVYVSAAAEEQYAGLSPAMVAALLRAEIVATTGDIRNDSNFVIEPDVGADDIVWSIFDANGSLVGEHVSLLGAADLAMLAAPGKSVSQAMRRQLDAAAASVVALIKGSDETATPIVIHIAQVDGAPGSGNIELTQSMRYVLSGIDGLNIVGDNNTDGAMVVAGTVTLGRPSSGLQDIVISWEVLDADGNALGTIDQGNQIAAGSLDGRWGETARQIALAASAGLTEMLTKVALSDTR